MAAINTLANSTLKNTILHINPTIDKKTQSELSRFSKIAIKENQSSKFKQKLFLSTFEARRNKRKTLFEKVKPKLDSASRNAIEKYKIE